MNTKIWLFLLAVSFSTLAIAQQPLPDFSIQKGPKNHTIISWRNNFGDMLTVLNVQRSGDSVKGFRTIYSVTNLTLSVNAYTDNKPQPGADYYRMYYMLKNGTYAFTKAKRIATGFVTDDLLSKLTGSQTITVNGENPRKVPLKSLSQLKDSVTNFTSDSLFYVNDSTIQYVKYNAVAAMAGTTENLIPVSKFLYLNTDNYIVIKLPENELNKYSMTIFKTDGRSTLFKIPRFDRSEIILGKSSFMHTGFYPYEIYKDGKLLERSRMEIK